VREQLGVAREVVTGGPQRFLVQRGGTDRVHAAIDRERNGAFDVLIGGVAGHGRQLSKRQIVRD
jgi:hypothetical protein